MRWLIDGYNIMHAWGRIGPNLGREEFRRARRRFLDDLASAMGSDEAAQTTVVFDASVPPGDFPIDSTYRGLRLIFALGDDDADARIEQIVEDDSNPRSLRVVSSDRRIRQAAARRRAERQTADEFWDWIDRARTRAAHSNGSHGKTRTTSPGLELRHPTTPEESAFWLETFRDVVESPETRAALAPPDALLTDAEIVEIQREVDREAGFR
jgi:predicted RNA-binding protein with PIN domain